MNELFHNITELEQVVYMQRNKSENDVKLPVWAFLAYCAVIAILLVLYFVIDFSTVLLLVLAAVISAVGVFLKRLIVDSMKPQASHSVQTTGDKIVWRYSFYEDCFTADKSGTDEAAPSSDKIYYGDIVSVNDMGSGYQIRADKNYTVKKNGFDVGGESKFVRLMKEKTNAAKLLRDVY